MATLIDDIAERRRLSGTDFTVSEHCSRQGDMPHDLWNFEREQPRDPWRYVGWAPSGATPIPKSNWGIEYSVAVLLENEQGDRVWLHVPVSQRMIEKGMR